MLVAVDVLYFNWADTDFFGALWEDQFAIQTGLQYTTKSGCKLRLGYAWAENATRDVVLANRRAPPDAILQEVYRRTGDRPFKSIDDVISRDEIVALSESYKRIAGYDKERLKERSVRP